MLEFKLLSLALLLLYWKAAAERAVFSWCWQQIESFQRGRCLRIDDWVFFSHIAIVWIGVLRKTFFSLQTNIAMEQKWAEFGNQHDWKIGTAERNGCWVMLLEHCVQELLAGCSERLACFAKGESFRKCLGINRCYIELPLKIPVEDWRCCTTSIKISP